MAAASNNDANAELVAKYDRVADAIYHEFADDLELLMKNSQIIRDAVTSQPLKTPRNDPEGGERHLFEDHKAQIAAAQARLDNNPILIRIFQAIVGKLSVSGLSSPPPKESRLSTLAEKLGLYAGMNPFEPCSAAPELPAQLLAAETALAARGRHAEPPEQLGPALEFFLGVQETGKKTEGGGTSPKPVQQETAGAKIPPESLSKPMSYSEAAGRLQMKEKQLRKIVTISPHLVYHIPGSPKKHQFDTRERLFSTLPKQKSQ